MSEMQFIYRANTLTPEPPTAVVGAYGDDGRLKSLREHVVELRRIGLVDQRLFDQAGRPVAHMAIDAVVEDQAAKRSAVFHPEVWSRVRVKPHCRVHIVVGLAGGGGGKKSTAMVFLSLAIAVAGAGIAAWAAQGAVSAGMATAGSIGAKVIGAAAGGVFSMAATALVGGLAPTPSPPVLPQAPEAEQQRYIGQRSNAADLFKPVKTVVGLPQRFYPQLAQSGFSEVVDDDQFLIHSADLGPRRTRVTDIRRGSTAHGDLADAELQVRDGTVGQPKRKFHDATVAEFTIGKTVTHEQPVVIGFVDECDLVTVDILVVASSKPEADGTRGGFTSAFRVDWRTDAEAPWRPVRSPDAPSTRETETETVAQPLGRNWTVRRLTYRVDRPKVTVRVGMPRLARNGGHLMVEATYQILVAEKGQVSDFGTGQVPAGMALYETVTVVAGAYKTVALSLADMTDYDIAVAMVDFTYSPAARAEDRVMETDADGLAFYEPLISYETAALNNTRDSLRRVWNTTQPQLATIRCPLPTPQRAEFRVVKVTPEVAADHNAVEEFLVYAVRRHIDAPPVLEVKPHSSLTDRIRVSGQFNGQPDPINGIVETLIDVYDPETRTYVPRYSANMAHIGSWLFRNGMRPVEHTHEEELVWLAFADHIEVEGIEIADVIDHGRSTVDDVSEMLAAAFASVWSTGRGTYLPIWRDFDRPSTGTVGMDNSWDFERLLLTPETPHALRIRGEDLEKNPIEVVHYLDGYDAETAEIYETVSVRWLRTVDALKTYAIGLVQQTLHQRALTKFKMRHQGFLYAIGERITYLKPKFSADRLDDRLAKCWHDEHGALVKVAFVHPVTLDSQHDYHLRFTTISGEKYAAAKPVEGATTVLELDSPMSVDQGGDLIEPGAHFILCRVNDTRRLDLIVVGYEPDADKFGVTTLICKDAAARMKDGIEQADGRYLIEVTDTVTPAPPQQVADLTLTETVSWTGTETESRITANWRINRDPKMVSGFNVIWRVDGRRIDHQTSETEASLVVAAGQQVHCAVIAVGMAPLFHKIGEHEAATETITATGRLDAPVAPFGAVVSLTDMGAEIRFASDALTDHVELLVRQPGGATAPVRRSEITGRVASVAMSKAGSYVVRLFAVNGQGTRSVEPLILTLRQNRDLVPNQILAHLVDTSVGTFSGDMSRAADGALARISAPGVPFAPVATEFDSVLFNPTSAFADVLVSDLVGVPVDWLQGPNRSTRAGWQSPIIDLGQTITGVFSADAAIEIIDRSADLSQLTIAELAGVPVAATAHDSDASVEIMLTVGEMADLSDGVTGHELSTTARYVQVEVLVQADSEVTDVLVRGLTLLVDGPDRVENGSFTLSQTTQTFDFQTDFAGVPHLIAQAIGGVVAVDSVTAGQMTISGAIGVSFNYRATGV